MIQIHIRSLLAGAQFAAGATAGQEHFSKMIDQIKGHPSGETSSWVFDFSDVEDVSASYIKSTILAANQCGRLVVDGIAATEAIAARVQLQPLDAVFAVVNANADVIECIDDVFAANNAAIVAGSTLGYGTLLGGQVLGAIDPKAFRTLELAVQFDSVTAAELHAAEPGEGISLTGWSNRLSDLYRRLLLRRQTSGRQHRYSPLVRGTVSHGKILSGK